MVRWAQDGRLWLLDEGARATRQQRPQVRLRLPRFSRRPIGRLDLARGAAEEGLACVAIATQHARGGRGLLVAVEAGALHSPATSGMHAHPTGSSPPPRQCATGTVAPRGVGGCGARGGPDGARREGTAAVDVMADRWRGVECVAVARVNPACTTTTAIATAAIATAAIATAATATAAGGSRRPATMPPQRASRACRRS